MQIERNADVPAGPLRLHGEDIVLTRCLANGESVSFRHEGGVLVIDSLPEGSFTLEIRNTCAPEKNTQLSGLYTSGGGFFTQCEAEGFRRITFFLDRPDVMAEYSVLIRANKAAYPVLLSNGNLVEEGELDNGRHFARWHDPFPKPSYLFALVAARLVAREQRVRSRSGKDHLLQVWVREGDLDKTERAMESLVASVVWDEARFGLPLDLERFMIVAVGDFNMGAMENKGLNLFNTKYVLANPATATDDDYAAIEAVVGHEYFHNWTGNRITCRDWFQLSLKEGLTVFRDQEFSMDMVASPTARAVRRIEAVRALRQVQFPEDAGAMAHPVRPDSYVEINNFYTATIYEKGAEVVRMMQSLVGREGFERGITLYFQRHDGQAVTCDDFAQAIADANPGSELAKRLPQFKRWYGQTGTPRADGARPVRRAFAHLHPRPRAVGSGHGRHDGARAVRHSAGDRPRWRATAGRWCCASRTSPSPRPRRTGCWCSTTPRRSSPSSTSTSRRCFRCCAASRRRSAWSTASATPSCVILLRHDSDPFNRWEAGQRLALNRLLAAVARRHRGAARRGLHRGDARGAAPAVARSGVQGAGADAAERGLHRRAARQRRSAARPCGARSDAARSSPTALVDDWQWAFEAHQVSGGYSPDPVSAGPACARQSRPGDALHGRAPERRSGLAGPRLAALQGCGQHDRPPGSADGAAWPRARCWPMPRSSGSTRSSGTTPWSSTSGSSCRPARRSTRARCSSG